MRAAATAVVIFRAFFASSGTGFSSPAILKNLPVTMDGAAAIRDLPRQQVIDALLELAQKAEKFG